MRDLDQALVDIGSIRRQMARSAEFRGYGPTTLALTGVFAVVASAIQGRLVHNPTEHPVRYLAIWITTAVLSAGIIAAQTFARTRRMHSGMADEMIHMAVEQFLPAAAAGALLTLVVVRSVPENVWMLPGLWQIVYGLGIFASCRFLPRPMLLAGGWFVLAGIRLITLAGHHALAPLAMAIPFGAGQLLIAAILYRNARLVGDED